MNRFDHITLTTPRLLLRPLLAADAPAVFVLRSDPLVNQYTGNTPWTSVESAQEFIARDLRAMENGEYLRLGMINSNNDDLFGTITLFHFDTQCRRAEIGYDMRPDMWGNAYMNEALLPVLELGYTDLNLNRIEADVDPANLASVKTLERLGFRQEGLLRERWIVNGVKSDTVFLGLLHADWLARHVES